MNEEINTPVTEADAGTATPLTDEQIAAILASKPAVADSDEVSEDEVTIH